MLGGLHGVAVPSQALCFIELYRVEDQCTWACWCAVQPPLALRTTLRCEVLLGSTSLLVIMDDLPRKQCSHLQQSPALPDTVVYVAHVSWRPACNHLLVMHSSAAITLETDALLRHIRKPAHWPSLEDQPINTSMDCAQLYAVQFAGRQAVQYITALRAASMEQKHKSSTTHTLPVTHRAHGVDRAAPAHAASCSRLPAQIQPSDFSSAAFEGRELSCLRCAQLHTVSIRPAALLTSSCNVNVNGNERRWPQVVMCTASLPPACTLRTTLPQSLHPKARCASGAAG